MREFQKTSISAVLTTPKPLTVWTTTNCGKFLKNFFKQEKFKHFKIINATNDKIKELAWIFDRETPKILGGDVGEVFKNVVAIYI